MPNMVSLSGNVFGLNKTGENMTGFTYDRDGATLVDELYKLFQNDLAALHHYLTVVESDTFIRLCALLLPQRNFDLKGEWRDDLRNRIYGEMIAVKSGLHAIWRRTSTWGTDIGTVYTLRRYPAKMLAFMSSTTKKLYNIGADDRVLAMSDTSTWPVTDQSQTYSIKVSVRFNNDKRQGTQKFTGVINEPADCLKEAEANVRQRIQTSNVKDHSDIVWDVKDFHAYVVQLENDGWVADAIILA